MLKSSRFLPLVLNLGFVCLTLGALANCAGSSSSPPGTYSSPQAQAPQPVVPDGNTQPIDTPHIFESMRIAPYLLPCTGQGQQLCLVRLDDLGKPAEFIYGSLGGFIFQWGHEYRLNILMDQSGVMTLAKVQADNIRSIVDSPGLLLSPNFVLNTQGYSTGNCDFTIAGEYALSVFNPDRCSQLNALLSSPLRNEQGFRMQLDVFDSTLGKLQLRNLTAVTTISWKELRFASSTIAITTFDSARACHAGPSAVQNTFVIRNDGRFGFMVCDHHVEKTQGQLTANELQKLRSLARDATESSIFAINCGAGQLRRSTQELYILSTEGDELSLFIRNFTGTCFRGEPSRMTNLVSFVSELQQRYNLLQLGPLVLP